MHEISVHRLARLGCIAAVWWPLMACQPTAPEGPTSATAEATGAAKNDQSAQEHLWRVNPSPKEKYEVALRIDRAPGPFTHVKWYAHYQASGCNYITNEWAGARSEPQKTLDLTLTSNGDMQWVGTVYLDAMLDEDSYGNGICRWKLTGVTASFQASSSAQDTKFLARLSSVQLQAGVPVTRYYSGMDYPKTGLPGFMFDGNADPSTFKGEHGSRLFNISLTPRVQR